MSRWAIRRFLRAVVAVAALGLCLGCALRESSSGNDMAKNAPPGSNASVSVEEAYSNAVAVVEGVVADEGMVSPVPPGEACYEGVNLKGTQGSEGSLKRNDKVKRIFPGSNISIEEAYSNAAAVVEGVVTDEGIVSPGSPGEACYEGVKLKVTQGYKGSFKTDETVTVDVHVRTLPANTAEIAPKKDDTLFLFVESREGKSDRANKIVPATREARDAIGVIARNGKGKL